MSGLWARSTLPSMASARGMGWEWVRQRHGWDACQGCACDIAMYSDWFGSGDGGVGAALPTLAIKDKSASFADRDEGAALCVLRLYRVGRYDTFR